MYFGVCSFVLDFTGFARIPMFAIGGQVEIISFVFRFYGTI